MGYQIVAEVPYEDVINGEGDETKVDAWVCYRGENSISFSISGDFDKMGELTRKLCNSLIDAGFFEFNIYHSY